MRIAITRAVSRTIDACALTFRERESIDYERAQAQHEAYESCLRDLGCHVVSLPPEDELPDAVFVEDTAVVVDEVAVMTSPKVEARRTEVDSVAAVLASYRPLRHITGTAHLEGGDVFRIGRMVFAGMSRRTNREGIDQLTTILEPYGYSIRPTQVDGCLHLKTACTYIGRNTILANPAWVDTSQFEGMDVLAVALDEPEGANGLLIGDTVVVSTSFPKTAAMLETAGFTVRGVDASELEKAEAGVTCCSIPFIQHES